MSKKIKHSNGTRFYRKKSTRAKGTKRRRTKQRRTKQRRTKQRRTKQRRTKHRTIRKRVNKRKKRKTKQILKGGSTDVALTSAPTVSTEDAGFGRASVAELEEAPTRLDQIDHSMPTGNEGGNLYDLDTALGPGDWTRSWSIVKDGEGRDMKRNKLTEMVYTQDEFNELLRRNRERVGATTDRLQSLIATPNKITPNQLYKQAEKNGRGGTTPEECGFPVHEGIGYTVNNYVSRIKRAEKFMAIHYVLCCDGRDLERPALVPSTRPIAEGIQFEWDVAEARSAFRRMWENYSLIGKGFPTQGQIDYVGLEAAFGELEVHCEGIDWTVLPPHAGEEKKVIHVIPELSEEKQFASSQADKQNGHYLHKGVADILKELCGVNLTYQRVSLCESRDPEGMCAAQAAGGFWHRDKYESNDELWGSGSVLAKADRWRAFNELKHCRPSSTYCTFSSGIDMTDEDIQFVSGQILKRQLIKPGIVGEAENDKQAVFIVSHGKYMMEIYGMYNEAPLVVPSNMDILHVYVEENPQPEVNAWQSAELFRWPHYISAQPARPARPDRPDRPVTLLQKVSEINSQHLGDEVGGGTHYFIMRHCPACHNLKRRYLDSLIDSVPDSSGHSSLCIQITPHWMILAELEPIFSLFSDEEIQFCASIIFRAILTCSLLVEKYRIYRRVVGSVNEDAVGGGVAIALPAEGAVGDEAGGGAMRISLPTESAVGEDVGGGGGAMRISLPAESAVGDDVEGGGATPGLVMGKEGMKQANPELDWID